MNMNIMAQFQPNSISDFVYNSQQSRDIIYDIVNGTVPFPVSGKNGILMYGVWGTGKSALAKILPQAIEDRLSVKDACSRYEEIKPGNKGSDIMVSIDRQTDLVPFSSYHYIVLDEVDLLTETAMSALKSIMNKPKTIFVMTTNHLNKIDRGVVNRSVLVDFNAAPERKWLEKVRQVLAAYGVAVEDDELLLDIIRPCCGSARDIMYAAHSLGSKIQTRAA